MKLCIGVLIAAASLMAAEDPKDKPAPKQQAGRAAKHRPAPVMSIPAGAKEISPGVWRHESEGKVWIYRKTPFGVSRMEEQAVEKQQAKADNQATENGATIRAFDDGEYVRFERPGPFGDYKWRRKKTELDATEKRAWERSQAGEKK